MVGGTTLGYSAVGNCRSATRPTRTNTNASTLASTGLSMKKREIMPVPRVLSLRCRFGGAHLGVIRRTGFGRLQHGSLRFDFGAGEGLLNSFGHHPVSWTEAGLDDHKLPLRLSGFDDLALNDIVRTDDQHVAALLARADRVTSRQQCLVLMANRPPDADEKSRHQRMVVVVEDRAYRHGTGRRVDLR